MTPFSIPKAGPIIGKLGDTPIHEWLMDQDGQRYLYVGLYDMEKDYSPEQLSNGDLIIAPGIHYRVLIEGDKT